MTLLHTIRPAIDGDATVIKQVAVDAKMFSAGDVGFFDDLLAGFLDGSLSEHRWLVLEDSEARVVASAYYAPEPFSDRVWNLYFIAVSPNAQGGGLGGALLQHVEDDLRARGEERARVLIIESSSTDPYTRTRQFYRARGFDEEATIRQFYGPEDHKVVFWKSLKG